jgi:arylsulfatase A-like enzyme
MKSWVIIFLKLCWGMYFILASLYCFLAFNTFTYLFVVVYPPYRWIGAFEHHNLTLLWFAVAASVLSGWLRRSRGIPQVIMAGEIALAVVASILNPIAHLQNNALALVWSLLFAMPLLATAGNAVIRRAKVASDQVTCFSISYYDASFVGFLASLISIAALRLNTGMHVGFLLLQRHDVELMFWVVVEHVTLAIAIASLINLTRFFLFPYIKNPFIVGSGVVGLVFGIGLALECLVFMEDSLGLGGWVAWGYSILFGATITLCGLSLIVSVFEKRDRISRWMPATIAILAVALATYVQAAIDPGNDWDGIIHRSSALLLWAVLAIAICGRRSFERRFPIKTILVVALATCGAYETLDYSKSLWAADISPDRTVISRDLSNYSAQNASFALVDTMLGNQQAAPCDAACKTFRQYSNMPDAKISHELNLTDDLQPTPGPKPNIFVIVIDSVRSDYLGTYNPRVDFTPNIDAFARDSVVMRRAYSDYAGTSLSEPAIWSGALLLHAHYAQPFEKVNSLAKLAHADGYQLAVSYDVILRDLLVPPDNVVKLDADKKDWNQIELSSTFAQLEDLLDRRGPQAPPVLFYTQPMNVHVNPDNNLPPRTSQNWRSREGFDDRIAYTLHQTDDILGAFFAYLRARNLYDSSIIIVTADHGEATPELGRAGHSGIIYPEVMRVPLIIHLPRSMRDKYVYDENRISALIDITPSLYYLLGHRSIKASPLLGRPMFFANADEFSRYPRPDLFLASDSVPVYGILAGDGRWMYSTYDSPAHSMLFDLAQDPKAQNNILTPEIKKQYDNRIIQYLQLLSDFYGFQPAGLPHPRFGGPQAKAQPFE